MFNFDPKHIDTITGHNSFEGRLGVVGRPLLIRPGALRTDDSLVPSSYNEKGEPICFTFGPNKPPWSGYVPSTLIQCSQDAGSYQLTQTEVNKYIINARILTKRLPGESMDDTLTRFIGSAYGSLAPELLGSGPYDSEWYRGECVVRSSLETFYKSLESLVGSPSLAIARAAVEAVEANSSGFVEVDEQVHDYARGMMRRWIEADGNGAGPNGRKAVIRGRKKSC